LGDLRTCDIERSRSSDEEKTNNQSSETGGGKKIGEAKAEAVKEKARIKGALP
jgi:hypothetical protein